MGVERATGKSPEPAGWKACATIGSSAGDFAPALSHTTGRAGFSHPAVERSLGVHGEARSDGIQKTTCSIRSSYIAFCVGSRNRVPTRSARAVRRGSTASPSLGQSGVVTVVVASRRFSPLFWFLDQVLIELCFFRSSVLRSVCLSADLIATTTSADSCGALAPQVSSGQCDRFPYGPSDSTCHAWMTFGFRCC